MSGIDEGLVGWTARAHGERGLKPVPGTET